MARSFRFSMRSLLIGMSLVAALLAFISFPFYGTTDTREYEIDCVVIDMRTREPVENVKFQGVDRNGLPMRDVYVSDEHGRTTLKGNSELRSYDSMIFSRFTTRSSPHAFIISSPCYHEQRLLVDEHFRVNIANAYSPKLLAQARVVLVPIEQTR